MKKVSKKYLGIVILVAFILFGLFVRPQKKVIRLGIFAGSNWDVPNGNGYKIIDDAIARFEKENPGVDVEYESGILKEDYSLWLSEQIIQGKIPDVFMILSEDFNTLSSLGVLQPLNALVQSDSDMDLSQFYDSALKMGQYNDLQVALPFENNPTFMFVNKTLLEKEGIPMPDKNWTMEDFYEICQKVTKDTNMDGIIDQFGCYNYTWLNAIFGYYAQLFDDKGITCYLTSDKVKQAFHFIKKLDDLNHGYRTTSTDFDDGNVAFSPFSFAQYRTYKPYPWKVKKYSNFEWECVKMPSASKKAHSEVSTLLMGMSKKTKSKELSYKLLKMLTFDEDFQQDLIQYSPGVSSLKSVVSSQKTQEIFEKETEGEGIEIDLIHEVMENAIEHKKFKKYESALNLIETRAQQILNNKEDIDIALTRLQKDVNQFLQE